MSLIRILLTCAVLLLLAGIVFVGRLPPAADAPAGAPADLASGGATRTAALTNDDCLQCHARVAEEWRTSFHSLAWSDDRVQATFQHFGFDRKCQSCHAPEPVFVTGLTAAPQLRPADVQSGVNCLSCHALTNGRVAARHDLPAAPCRPQAVAELTESQACAGCHTAIFKDWDESRYKTAGKTCQTCHMPAVLAEAGGSGKNVQGEPTPAGAKPRFSHVSLGGHDPATVRSGAQMACRQEGDMLVVEVTNHATGHNFPGERHNRLLLIQVIQRKPDGTITVARQELIKGITPFRGETSAEKLKVDETHTARFPVVQAPVTAEVQLLYKPFPWITDRESLVVHSANVELAP